MRLLVYTSKGFDNYKLLASKLDKLVSKVQSVIVLTGGPRGPDERVDHWARSIKRKYPIEEFKPLRSDDPKCKGLLAINRMVEKADAVVVFYDGRIRGGKNVSPDARHVLIMAKYHKRKIPVRIIRYNQLRYRNAR